MPRISLISVNFNGLDYLEAFFTSVFAQDFPAEDLEVIMVDNGSIDGSVAFVRERFPAVRVIELPDNQGFARPNNLAAEAATGDHLALLNNDMRLEPDWLTRMAAAREATGAACVASRILNWDGTRVDFIEGRLAFHGMGSQTAFRAPVDSPEGTRYPRELLFACGGAMLIDRAAYLDVGGFDEDYFAYFEDVDLGWRLWVLGYRVAFCPEAVAYHHHNGTSSRFGLHRKLVLFERNALYTLIKNYGDETLDRALPAALLLAFKRMAVRSGVDRAEFRFELPAPPRPPASWRGLLRDRGPKLALKQVLVDAAERFLARYNPRPEEVMWVQRNAYATVVGLEDLADHLPKLMEKRRAIQARRKRTDREIVALFKDPFDPVDGHPDYRAVHAAVLEHWGVGAFFRELLAEAVPHR